MGNNDAGEWWVVMLGIACSGGADGQEGGQK